jgi:3-phenylpropionate/trans-cinnamate dioxygenase ferredoxin reductase subunit
VVVVEPLAEPLLRVLGPTVGRFFSTLHRSHGVDLRTHTNVLDIRTRLAAGSTAEGGPAVVDLDDGTAVEADLVVVGIGAVPSTGLAAAAGLQVENGVLTDEYLRTSHSDVLAAGDLANAWHPRLLRNLRVEHWDNAIAQGATAARNLLGAGEVYDRLPYFYSDQYDLGMEYVGHVASSGDDELVLRGHPASGVFTAFWVKDDRVVAAMHANDWDAITPMRAVVAAAEVDLAALRDPRVPLAEVAP